jgi:polyphosphate glucokinase
VINDADAAGLAEVKFGAGRGSHGLTIMTTLGTGIGTALFYNGVLIPNAELGHLEIEGVDYETKAAYSAMERDGLSFEQWAERLQKYYSTLERLLVPDLFIVGGGVSKNHEKFLPLLNLKTPIVPATTKNSAGIIGAASLAYASSED